MRLIIPCAGKQERWNKYLGVYKQMVPVFDEPLLQRTVRQFQERVPEISIHVPIRPDMKMPDIPGVEFFQPYANRMCEYDKVLSSRPHWSEHGRTTIVFGDVFLTDEAADIIAGASPSNIHWFGRSGPSKVTGCGWEELFGLTFQLTQQQRLERVAEQIRAHCRKFPKKATRLCLRKAWILYRRLEGLRPRHPGAIGDNFTEIDDRTEDFDSPEDYEAWKATSTSQPG